MAGRELRGEDLSGSARDMFEAWRALGHTELQAMRFLRDDGVLAEAGVDDPFDRLVDMGRGLGLSESESRAFATGRDGSEWEARKALREAVRPAASEDLQREFTAAAEAVDLAMNEERRSAGEEPDADGTGRWIVQGAVHKAVTAEGGRPKTEVALETIREVHQQYDRIRQRVVEARKAK